MKNSEIKSIDDWNVSYTRRLMPFLGLSVVVHVVVLTVMFGLSSLFAGGKGLEVQLFDPGASGEAGTVLPLLGGIDIPERIKVFRIDFFREIIPWSPPEPEPLPDEGIPAEDESSDDDPVEIDPEVEEPDIEEPSDEEPDEGVEVTDDNPEQISTVEGEDIESLLDHPRDLFGSPDITPPPPLLSQPVLSNEGDDGAAPDAFGTFGGSDETETGANVRMSPDWKLKDMINTEWTHEYFLGNYTIYIIGDISSRHGHEDILAWNYVLRQLVTNPHAAYPPNVVTIAAAMENPYGYDSERIVEILDEAHEEEFTFGVQIVDPDGSFPLSLGYTELPQPIVMFVDQNGFIRMILIGRIRDISNANIDNAMGVIAEMWMWDDDELGILPTATMLLINLLRDQAYDPEVRKVPPEEIVMERFPEWGYPSLPEDIRDSISPSARDPKYDYAPF